MERNNEKKKQNQKLKSMPMHVLKLKDFFLMQTDVGKEENKIR